MKKKMNKIERKIILKKRIDDRSNVINLTYFNDFSWLKGKIIVNEFGHYFDFVVGHSDFNKYITKIEDLNPTCKTPQIVLYPSSDEIRNNFPKIKDSNCTIVIPKYWEYNNSGINLLKTYFNKTRLQFNDAFFFEYINIPYHTEEQLIEHKSNPFLRFIFMVIKMRDTLDLNLSWLKGVNETNYKDIIEFKHLVENKYALQRDYPNAFDYLGKVKNFDIDTFTRILFCDITKMIDPETRLILKLLDIDINYKAKKYISDLKDYELIQNLPKSVENLKKEGLIIEVKEGVIKLV